MTRGANRVCEFCLTTQHGSTYAPFRSKTRFLNFFDFPPLFSPWRLSCLPWSWQGRRHPWASLLTHARLLEATFRSSVSVSKGSQWTRPAQQSDITEDLRTDLLDAHHLYRFPEVPHTIAKSLANHSHHLPESLHAGYLIRKVNLRRREQPLQKTVCFSMGLRGSYL